MTEKDFNAEQIVKRYSLYSGVAGLIPVPLVDIAAITGVQLKMVSDLAKAYGVPFYEDQGKAIVSALLGSVIPTRLGFGAAGSFLKAVPVVGPVLGIFTTSIFGSAATWAVGKVFIQHFASGGTFLDFDPDKVRAYFKSEYEQAKTKAA